MKIGVLTISDSRSESDDLSGPAVVAGLKTLGYTEFETRIVRDEAPEIQAGIRELSEICAAVFTAGGTGFTPRDVTPEATAAILHRRADNLCELMRMKGLATTPFSHLSRGIAGIYGTALVVNLPGSPKGAAEGIAAIGNLIGPILSALRGEGCPV